MPRPNLCPQRPYRARLVLILTIGVLFAGCGGGDPPTETTTGSWNLEACVDRYLRLTSSDEMDRAVTAGTVPDALQDELDAFDDDCSAEFVAAGSSLFTEHLASVDPAVMALLGGSDPEAGEGPVDCVDRFIELVSTDEVLAAARADADPSPELATRLEAIGRDCSDVFEGRDAVRYLDAIQDLDAVVLDWLSKPDPAEFDETSDSITG